MKKHDLINIIKEEVQSVLTEDRLTPYVGIKNAAEELAKELWPKSSYSFNGSEYYVNFGFPKMFTRGDGTKYKTSPISIDFVNRKNYENAKKDLEKYLVDTINDHKLYFFPKYKIYGRFDSEISRGYDVYSNVKIPKINEKYKLEIFGKKQYQNMKYDLEKKNIR